MRIVVHRDIPDDRLLQQQWNALVQEMEYPEVFYTHQWALAVRRVFGKSVLPILILAYEGDKLAGVAALAADPDQNATSFLCSTSADYCDLLSHPDLRAELLDAVLAELCRADLPHLVLTSLPAESATIQSLPSISRKHGYHLFVRATAMCAQVELGDARERIKLKTTLGKKKIFRHSMNSFSKEGPVSFGHLVTWEAIEPVLAGFSVAHVARFLAMGRISNMVNANRRAFLSELARLLSKSGWLVLSRMLVADRTVAWNYGFQFQGKWFWYQPTFNTSHERLSPGYCLLSKIISDACDRTEMRVVDLGLGAEGYKERFANSARSTLNATLTKSLGRHKREVARYRAAQALKSVPRAESAVRAVLRYIGHTRTAFKEGGIPGFVERGTKRVVRWLSSSEEYVFYTWVDNQSEPNIEVSSERLRLKPIDFETLAVAAMSYENEEDTLSYIIRSARRLRSTTTQGFALTDADNTPVHFGWVADFEGFEMKELKTRLSASSQNAAMICDCWTPKSKRGRGYFGMALSLAARHVAGSGKAPWIFSAITDPHSGQTVEQAGFEKRYSMICKKTLVWKQVSKVALDQPGWRVEAQARS
jgi:CelD/BcsL family acetyltransferase involved in cellulose biosynthesis